MFTKGEWFARILNKQWVITSDIGVIVWLAKISGAKRLNVMNEANAHLIAQAPTLLRELRSAVAILREIHGYQDTQPVLSSMVKAIAGAEGKTE